MKFELDIAIDGNNKDEKYWEYIFELICKKITKLEKKIKKDAALEKEEKAKLFPDGQKIGFLPCDYCGKTFEKKRRSKYCMCEKCSNTKKNKIKISG